MQNKFHFERAMLQEALKFLNYAEQQETDDGIADNLASVHTYVVKAVEELETKLDLYYGK